MTKTIIVSGLGRCGSSLTMQMLEAAGVRMNGEHPAFEGPLASRFTRGSATEADWAACEGKATKILVADSRSLPALCGPVSVLWLHRDKREQARSQAKMACLLNDLPMPSRAHLRHWSASLTQEDRVWQRRWRAMGAEVFTISYDDIITSPFVSASLIAVALELDDSPATIRRVGQCVRKRAPRCAPDLSMEAALVSESMRREAAG